MSYYGDPGLPPGSPPSDRENDGEQSECEVCGASDPQWCDPAKHGAENVYGSTDGCLCGCRRNGHPCSLCGCDPCESPSACRSQARFEDDPGDAGEFVEAEYE